MTVVRVVHQTYIADAQLAVLSVHVRALTVLQALSMAGELLRELCDLFDPRRVVSIFDEALFLDLDSAVGSRIGVDHQAV